MTCTERLTRWRRPSATLALTVALVLGRGTSSQAEPQEAEPELVPAGSINDAIAKRPILVWPQDDAAVRAYADAVRRQFFSTSELRTGRLSDADRRDHNFLVYGTVADHPWLRTLRDRLPFQYERNAVTIQDQRFEGSHLRVIAAIRNPSNPECNALLYTAAKSSDLPGINNVFHGPTGWVVADGDRVLASGSFTSLRPLSPEQLQADLDFLVETLETIHPATIDGLPTAVEEAIGRAEDVLDEPLSIDEWWLSVQDVIAALHDAHSTFAPPPTNRAIDLSFKWLAEGPVVDRDLGPVRKGDVLVEVGSHSIADLEEALERIVPAETPAWVRHRAPDYVRNRPLLDRLGIAPGDGAVDVRLRRGRKTVRASLPTTQLAGLTPPPPRPDWVRWSVDRSRKQACFTLDSCRFDAHYQRTLRAFFEAVHQAGVQHIAVDLRANGGGNSKVVDEFVRYLDVDSYDSYTGAVRTSEASNQQRNQQQTVGYREYGPRQNQNDRVEGLPSFEGRLTLFVGPATFSGGNWFAVIVRDNELGTIVGEATGNAPSAYGDILQFTLPESRLGFSVSYKRWIRPDPSRDPETCITPDVSLPRTAQDIKDGRDPCIEWLKEQDD